jgi:hypothetical protein
MNAHHEELPFVLPLSEWGESWGVLVDTRTAAVAGEQVEIAAHGSYAVTGRSLVIMKRLRG